MIINHNIAALNTYRMLSANNTAASKSLEKLSSGLRINRAGDDAAGLAISEKMRGQIRGLNQAIRNAQDGISLIQTAEGALNETHAILQRMRELAVQAANDTNTTEDRIELQKEVDQLAQELTRIANDTEFNTQKLLDGTFAGRFHIGANEGQNIELSIGKMTADSLNVAGADGATMELTTAMATGNVDGSDTAADNHGAIAASTEYTVTQLSKTIAVIDGSDQVDANYAWTDSDGKIVAISNDGNDWYALDYATTEAGLSSATLHKDDSAAVKVLDLQDGVRITSGTVTTSDYSNNVLNVTASEATLDNTLNSLKTGTYTITDVSNNASFGGTFKVGLVDADGNVVALGASALDGTPANADMSDLDYWVDVNDWSKALLTLGDEKFNDAYSIGDTIVVSGKGIDISSQASADKAITTIQKAIEFVSGERSKLGAYQNRLEHTINNLGTSAENLTAAESRIRDVDMAKEMMEFTKMSILSQAAQAMLAQANQMPQGVLQLLR